MDLQVVIDRIGVPVSVEAAGDANPLLADAATADVREWRFKATALNCVPVDVATRFRLEFPADSGNVRLVSTR